MNKTLLGCFKDIMINIYDFYIDSCVFFASRHENMFHDWYDKKYQEEGRSLIDFYTHIDLCISFAKEHEDIYLEWLDSLNFEIDSASPGA